MRTALLVAWTALVAAAPRLAAQTVPAVSFEVAAGSGAHTMHTASTYYQSDRPGTYRVAASFRLGGAGPLRPVLTLEHASACPLAQLCAEDSVCSIAPDRSCEKSFEAPDGNSVALGLEGAWSKYLTGGVQAGVAKYAHGASYIGANVALRILPHTAWVLDARRIYSTDSRGARTWFRPFSMGIRIY